MLRLTRRYSTYVRKLKWNLWINSLLDYFRTHLIIITRIHFLSATRAITIFFFNDLPFKIRCCLPKYFHLIYMCKWTYDDFLFTWRYAFLTWRDISNLNQTETNYLLVLFCVSIWFYWYILFYFTFWLIFSFIVIVYVLIYFFLVTFMLGFWFLQFLISLFFFILLIYIYIVI